MDAPPPRHAPEHAQGDDLRAEVAARVRALAPNARRLLVAVSGGRDSVAALRLLHGSAWQVEAAHFDHRLRPDSAADAAFVQQLCDGLGVRLHRGSADVAAIARQRGWNVEDGARRLRYAFLHRVAVGGEPVGVHDVESRTAPTEARSADVEAQVAPTDARPADVESPGASTERFDVIVVAHTRDDQAETTLLQLFRGAAFPAGMAARQGMVVRPLLGVARATLTTYLESIDQAWREDATNLDLERNRAWLRHEVLPAVERRFPGAATRVAATALTLRDAEDGLAALAAQRFGAAPLHLTALAHAPAALRRVAIARVVEAAGAAPTREAIAAVEAAVLSAAATGTGAAPWRRDVGGGRVARVAYGRLDVVRSSGRAERLGEQPGERPGPRPGEAPGRRLGRAAPELAAQDVLAVGSSDDLPPGVDVAVLERYGPLSVRTRRSGDRIRLPIGTRLVSDVLIDAKVPREERDALKLLVAGEDEVLWIEGVAAIPGVATGPVDADVAYMARALEQARLAAGAGELPVGAVVVLDGEVVAEAHNRSEAEHDPTAHAELLALRQAADRVGDWRLTGATLFVTLEPCPMCLGAALQTHLARIVYGASNVREGALGSVVDLRAGEWKRAPEVIGGVLAGASARLLREFFEARRG